VPLAVEELTLFFGELWNRQGNGGLGLTARTADDADGRRYFVAVTMQVVVGLGRQGRRLGVLPPRWGFLSLLFVRPWADAHGYMQWPLRGRWGWLRN